MASDHRQDQLDSVAAYKVFLRECLDRRPSGLRQKLAQALGKHKSFISQITSPNYTVPIPAGDLTIIFEVCHLSPDERRHFLELYEKAHPERSERARRPHAQPHEVRITLPAFRSEKMARLVEKAIVDTANRLIGMARSAEDTLNEIPQEDSDEKTDE